MGMKYPGLLFVFLLLSIIGNASGAIYVENATVFNFSLNTTSKELNSSIDSVHPRIFTEHIDSILGQSLTTPSPELNNSLNTVRPRIFTEHIDSILGQSLSTPSLELNNSLNTVRPRIFTEHIDSILGQSLTTLSLELNNSLNTVRPRIFTEHIDSIFDPSLTTPSLELNNSLNTVRPRIFTEHIDSILGQSLTTPSLELNNSLNTVRPRIFTEHIDSILIRQLNVISPELDNSISKVKPRIFVESADMLWFKPLINVTLNFTSPSTPPVPHIVSPSDGSIISGTVAVNATTSSPGITSASFDYTIDGLSWTLIGKDTNGDDGWDVLWDTNEVSDGVYALKVVMVDVNGSIGTNSIAVTVFNHPKVILTALPSRKTVENINASHSIGIFNSQYKVDTFDLTISNSNNAAVAALDQSSITIPPWESKEVTLNVTDETPGEYTVNVSAISRSNPNITGNVAVKTIVKESFNISLDPIEGTRTSIGANITYSLTLKNNQLYSDSFTLTAVGINPSWISFDASHILASGEEKTIPIMISIPETAISGDSILTISATSSNTGTTRRTSLPLNIQNGPIMTGLVPKDGSRLGSDSVIFTWTTNLNSTTKVILNQSGAETVYTGDDSVYHSIIVDNLTRNQWYTYRAISNTSHGSTVSEVRSFYIDNGISFTQKTYNFSIERNYDQRATITVKNTDTKAHELLLTVNSSNSDLIVGFVGNGSQDKRITLAPSEVKDVTLAIHAQDAMLDDYYLLLNLTADDDLTDYAVANVLVRQPIVDLRLEEISTDPLTLTKTLRIINQGDTVTDLNIYASGDLRGNVTFQPTITHGNLPSGGSITFDVAPVLSQDFTGMNGAIVAEASGKNKSISINFTLPLGKKVYLGYVGSELTKYKPVIPDISDNLFVQQISNGTIIVDILATFNDSNAVFLINSTIKDELGNVIVEVDSLERDSPDFNKTEKAVWALITDLSIGNYTISVREKKLGTIIASKPFRVHPFGIFLDSDGMKGRIRVLRGNISNNNDSFLVEHPLTMPFGYFEYTNFWTGSNESTFIGFEIQSEIPRHNVTMSLISEDDDTIIEPISNYFEQTNSTPRLFLFALQTNQKVHGIYSLKYSLNYTDEVNKSLTGVIPFGIYEFNISKNNNTITGRFISPFNDELYQESSDWINISSEGLIRLNPLNTSYQINYTNFSLREPYNPVPVIIVAYVVGAAVSGIFEIGNQIWVEDKSIDKIEWDRVGKEAVIGGGIDVLTMGISKGAKAIWLTKGIGAKAVKVAGKQLLKEVGIKEIKKEILISAGKESTKQFAEYVGDQSKEKIGKIITKFTGGFIYLSSDTVIEIISTMGNKKELAEVPFNLIGDNMMYLLENNHKVEINRDSGITTYETSMKTTGTYSSLDSDGDGSSILSEEMFGTNPFDPYSNPFAVVSYNKHDWYCTNRPHINTLFYLPSTIKETNSPTPNIEEAYLIIKFTLPWDKSAYRPHDVYVLLNGIEIGSIKNTIPEGYYTISFDPSILNYAKYGIAANTITLDTEHLNGGHYVISSDMKIVLRAKRIEMPVIANNQTEANEIIKSMTGALQNLPDFSARYENIHISDINPVDGDQVTINATIYNIGSLGMNYVPVRFYDNGHQIDNDQIITRMPMVGHQNVSIVWNAISGYHNITMKVNPDNTILESDYSNNEASKLITVGSTSDKKPPQSITNPSLQAAGTTWLNFTWLNPSDPDYHHVMLYLNGSFKTSILAPQNYYNFTGLEPDTVYELGTHTVDSSGNVNETWVNATGRTAESIQVTNPSANPAVILNDNGRPRLPGRNITHLNVTVTGNVASVMIDLSPIGGLEAAPMTKISGTDIYTTTTNATSGINLTHYLVVTATDTRGNFNNSVSIPLTVLLRGDIVRDNKIDLKDLLYMRRHLAGLEPSINPVVADIQPAEGDGKVDLKDLLFLRRYLAGLEPVI